MKKRVLSMMMIGALAIGTLAGCGSSAGGNSGGTGTDTNGAVSAESENKVSADGASYDLITNTWGAGAYPLDSIVAADNYLCDNIGMTLDVANNEFTADKVISQLQNQLAANPDGVLFLGVAATTFQPAVNAINAKGIPYAFDSNAPEDAVLEKCLEDETFCGLVSANPYDMGVAIAEQALADGCKTAVLTCAAIGDYSHDNRAAGFKDTFEAGGGEVLGEAHSSDPSEAVSKTNDIITAYPDADCIYATGGDYLSACISVKQQRPDLECKVYGTDVDPSVIPSIQDGTIDAMNGGQSLCGSVALTLVINYLDGHKIVDENGLAPCFDNFNPFVITKDNAEQFNAFYESGDSFITLDTYKSLLYRYNPDVSIDTYNDVLEGFADDSYALIGAN